MTYSYKDRDRERERERDRERDRERARESREGEGTGGDCGVTCGGGGERAHRFMIYMDIHTHMHTQASRTATWFRRG